jgi:predicted dehydrogenase
MKKLRVATIGAGYFSQFHYDAWSRIENVELVALCDLDPNRAKVTSERWSVPKSFADPAAMLTEISPDLVDIITPPASHLQLISLVAEKKINAICQKAFCQSITEALEATRIAEKAGILLVVHENYRFQPWHMEIKRRLDARDLGEIYQARFCLRPGDGQKHDAYLNRQPYFQRMERFLVHETAIHFIDIFRLFFGDVQSVFADLRRLNPVIAGEDAGLVLFRHQNGIRSVFDGNRLSDHPAKDRRLTMGEMLIEGERGVLRLDGDGNLSRRSFGSNKWEYITIPWKKTGFAGDSVRVLQQHVIDHLVMNKPVVNTAASYIANLRVEEAIYASAHRGAFQDIA